MFGEREQIRINEYEEPVGRTQRIRQNEHSTRPIFDTVQMARRPPRKTKAVRVLSESEPPKELMSKIAPMIPSNVPKSKRFSAYVKTMVGRLAMRKRVTTSI